MTMQELKQLKVGTLVYNGRTEGMIKEDCGEKVISVHIPLSAMSNDAMCFDERPRNWMVLDD